MNSHRLLLLTFALSGTALAQQPGINVDIGSLGYGAGIPAATYGAASGSVGTWNGIDSDAMAAAGGTFNSGPLMDVTGAMTAVDIDFDAMGLGFLAYEFDEPNTTGDDQALMDDIYYVSGLHTITINGLAPGAYTLYTYAMAPDSAAARTTVNVGGSPDPLAIVGGDFAGGFVRDVTHAEHAIVVPAGGGPVVIEIDLATNFDSVNGLQIVPGSGGNIGTPYCTVVPNSTGFPGLLTAAGSVVAANDDVTLTASQLPPNAFGFFLVSTAQGFVPNAGGSAGNLCLSGNVGRYVGPGQVLNSGASGEFSLALVLAQTPTPTGFVVIVGGQTWYFQTWSRDASMGMATSNFSNGLEVSFQ